MREAAGPDPAAPGVEAAQPTLHVVSTWLRQVRHVEDGTPGLLLAILASLSRACVSSVANVQLRLTVCRVYVHMPRTVLITVLKFGH
eukprot:2051361-Prymnesium_polylepis.2